MSLPTNFLSKTRPSDCIVWTGALNSRGYGCFAVNGVSQLVHRLAYEDAHGPIGEGLTVDHLCGFRRCVNPDHLEAVTSAENSRRSRVTRDFRVGGHCGKGHLLDADNLYLHPRGQLVCRKCQAQLRPVSPIRVWALANAIPVAPRGRIPRAVIDAYEQAMGDADAADLDEWIESLPTERRSA